MKRYFNFNNNLNLIAISSNLIFAIKGFLEGRWYLGIINALVVLVLIICKILIIRNNKEIKILEKELDLLVLDELDQLTLSELLEQIAYPHPVLVPLYPLLSEDQNKQIEQIESYWDFSSLTNNYLPSTPRRKILSWLHQ